MKEPDWIVLRFGPEVPREIVSEEIEGRWFDRTALDGKVETSRVSTGTATKVATSVARPTGRFEFDGSFQVAEVWEIEFLQAS